MPEDRPDFPTRADIATTLENLQTQLNQRFECQKEIAEVQLSERDKAVNVLERGIVATTKEADQALRDHITQQIAQVREALIAADKLELCRMEVAEAKLDGIKRELVLTNEFRSQAITKAEMAGIARGDSNAEKINLITDRINRSEGKGQGLNAGWVILSGIIALAATIISIISAFKP